MNDCVNKGQFVITFWNDGENKGVEVFQNMDEVIKYVGDDSNVLLYVWDYNESTFIFSTNC